MYLYRRFLFIDYLQVFFLIKKSIVISVKYSFFFKIKIYLQDF